MATRKKPQTSITIRMYRMEELGDCFLLTVRHNATVRNMLVDCGSFRNGDKSEKRIRKIVTNIQDEIGKNGKKLHIVAGTHQHNDHVSGFVHARDIFENIPIEQVWLSWLDNPRSKVAARIEQDHLGLRRSLHEASTKMKELSERYRRDRRFEFAAKRINAQALLVDGLLGFFGSAPALPSEGIRILKKIGENAVDYLNPGDVRTLPGIPASEIKIHILGPPRDQELLYRKNPRKGESYDHKLHAMHSMSAHFMNAVRNRVDGIDTEEQDFPFNRTFKQYFVGRKSFSTNLATNARRYEAVHNEWRNIDTDWLEQASRLALYMDTYTNNSSLAFAIELVKSEKVLLFAADAQTGNWLSWDNVKFKDKETTLDGLLERTAFYKAGHHGSHNSTLKMAFEKIKHDELVVMIPVDKRDPNIAKKDGWKMPAGKLLQRLKEKSQFRVLTMDDGYAEECEPKKNGKKNQWDKVGDVEITDLYIDYTIS